MKTGNNRHIPFLLLISLLIAGAGCSRKTETTEVPAAYCIPDALKSRIRIDTAGFAPVTESRRLTGEVAYNPDRVLHYISLVNGIIVQTYFSLGDYVNKGQVLAEIRSNELSGLESERKTLESRLSVAIRNVASVQSMYDDGIASGKNLLEAKSEEQILRAELEKTKNSLAAFSPGNQPGTFLIKAPAGGYIVDKRITSGIQVNAGNDPLFTISDLTNVWVTANVYTGDLSYIQENMPVQLRSAAYPDEIFTGTIKALSQVFDAEEKVLKARIVMDNPGLKLKPGMFIDVLVQKESGGTAIRIPKKAVIFHNNRDYVLVYQSDCNTEIREVAIAGESNGDVFIGNGIAAGERIITRNQLLIFEAVKDNKK